jgi:lipoprotein-releasing system permease protein
MFASSFSWFVARRYLTAQRRQAFIGLISLFSIVGVGVGVAAVIIALALMTGVQAEMRDRIVGSTAHMFVRKISGFEDWTTERPRMLRPGIVAAAPTLQGPALIDPGAGQRQFALLTGIDPVAQKDVIDLEAAMRTGSLADLADVAAEERDRILIGKSLADEMGVRVGDQVDVLTTAVSATPMGLAPRRRPFKIIGTFEFGLSDVDTQFVFVTLRTAEEMLNQRWDVIQLKTEHLSDTPRIKQELADALGSPYYVQDWTDMNASLYSALWLEKVAISLAVGLIVMVAALNIVASLVLLVMEKTHDIAILRTIGAPAAIIRRIFVLQGLAVGLIGTSAGVILGVGVSVIADRYRLVSMPPDVYHISHLPFRVLPLDVAVVVVAAIAICLTATVYPSWRAGRIDPAEALRHQ